MWELVVPTSSLKVCECAYWNRNSTEWKEQSEKRKKIGLGSFLENTLIASFIHGKYYTTLNMFCYRFVAKFISRTFLSLFIGYTFLETFRFWSAFALMTCIHFKVGGENRILENHHSTRFESHLRAHDFSCQYRYRYDNKSSASLNFFTLLYLFFQIFCMWHSSTS